MYFEMFSKPEIFSKNLILQQSGSVISLKDQQ